MQHWQENTCGGAGLKLYKERESGAGIFLWFLRNFLRSPFLSRKFLGARSLIITWITSFLRFLFFWLTWCVFMGLLVHFAYVLVFLSSNNDLQIVLTDPVNVLPMVLGKPLGFLIKSSPICLGQQNWNSLQLFCNNLAISYEWLKWKGINHSYLKKLLEW